MRLTRRIASPVGRATCDWRVLAGLSRAGVLLPLLANDGHGALQLKWNSRTALSRSRDR